MTSTNETITYKIGRNAVEIGKELIDIGRDTYKFAKRVAENPKGYSKEYLARSSAVKSSKLIINIFIV